MSDPLKNARIAENYLEHDDIKALGEGEFAVVGLAEDGTCVCYDPQVGLFNDGERPADMTLSLSEKRRLKSLEKKDVSATYTLQPGTVLMHGTSSCFEPHEDDLVGPAWFSRSESVARNFVGDHGGQKRILVYEVTEPITLPCFRTSQETDAWCEKHGIERTSAEDIANGVKAAGVAGWIIPDNYPDGDDILLRDLRSLKRLPDIELEPRPEPDADPFVLR